MRKRKHKLVRRTKQQTIKETICVEPRCRFRGEPAEQGVCFGAEGEVADIDKLTKHDAELTAELKAMRKREGKNYVAALEAHYICAMMNWTLTLDECIRLRRDLALAKLSRK